MNLELVDKTALISGSTKGIGFAVASQLATGKLWKDLPGEEREAKLQAKATSDLLTARAGIPDDAAKSYLYAIYNPYVTGQTIVVDGGGSLT
jgi:NAD(P)-dependent dehydrogenase (short-subunit alcohol dehydrogenase family)